MPTLLEHLPLWAQAVFSALIMAAGGLGVIYLYRLQVDAAYGRLIKAQTEHIDGLTLRVRQLQETVDHWQRMDEANRRRIESLERDLGELRHKLEHIG